MQAVGDLLAGLSAVGLKILILNISYGHIHYCAKVWGRYDLMFLKKSILLTILHVFDTIKIE